MLESSLISLASQQRMVDFWPFGLDFFAPLASQREKHSAQTAPSKKKKKEKKKISPSMNANIYPNDLSLCTRISAFDIRITASCQVRQENKSRASLGMRPPKTKKKTNVDFGLFTRSRPVRAAGSVTMHVVSLPACARMSFSMRVSSLSK